MGIKMDGKALADKICLDLKARCDTLKAHNFTPKLTIITTGEDSASKVYVRNKVKRCEEIGIEVDVRHFDKLNYAEFDDVICPIQNPIIVQEPIAGDVTHAYVAGKLFALNDVDGFTHINMGLLATGNEPYHQPCTPSGVMRLLEEYNIPLKGKNALVIGRSNIVGRPMAMMLEHAGCTVTVAHSKTGSNMLLMLFAQADIVVSAVGKKDIISLHDLEGWYSGLENKILIDVGMNRDENGKLCGDFSEELKQKAAYYTPTPGGTGPMTVAMLMQNVIEYYERYYF